MLNNDFERFGMSKGSPKINHLALANNMIIMFKAEVKTMKLISSIFKKYEKVFDQKVNKEKSVIYLHHSTPEGNTVMAKVATRILIKDFSFTYLECPIFYKRKQKFILSADDLED